MAKKKLNTKVAIVGLVILLPIMGVVGYMGLKYLSGRDPVKCLANARKFTEAKDYENAELNYGRSFGRTKENTARIEILFEIAEFHLINDGDLHEPNWNGALSCWTRVINIDPDNIEAQKKLLDFYYTAADSGSVFSWSNVEKTATEMLEIIAKKELEPDTFVLLSKGRSVLELAGMGQKSDRQQALTEATENLEKVKLLTPEDIEVYKLLSEVELIRGQIATSQGDADGMIKAYGRAQEILEQGTANASDKVKAKIYLLESKLSASRGDIAKLASLGIEVEQLTEEFSNSGEAFELLTNYYLRQNELKKAIEAIGKAVELEPENVDYAISASSSYYLLFSREGQEEYFDKAVETATEGLQLPGAQNLPGPRQFSQINRRMGLLNLLSRFYIERVLDGGQEVDESQKEQWLSEARGAIRAIEQLGRGIENIMTIKWHGLLALAEGDIVTGAGQMYSAYEQMKSTGQMDPVLAYRLANVFKSRKDVGARKEFLEAALFLNRSNSIASSRPEAILEYADLLLQFRSGASNAVRMVDLYEGTFPVTEQSRHLRVRGYINAGQLDEAAAKIKELDGEKTSVKQLKYYLANTQIKRLLGLQAKQNLEQSGDQEGSEESFEDQELADYQKRRAELLEEITAVEPEIADYSQVLSVCRYYLVEEKVDKANILFGKYLSSHPDNISAKVFMAMLQEPDPMNISESRQNEIREQAISEIDNEADRHVATGKFYMLRRITEEELAELKSQGAEGEQLSEFINQKAEVFKEKTREAFGKALALSSDNGEAISGLFDIALQSRDISGAEELLPRIRSLNLDDCEGNFYSARLESIKENYEQALNRVNDSLEIRPVFSEGYLLKSKLNSSLGRHEDAIEDARKAWSINPLDGLTSRQLASVLYDRNIRLGSNVSEAQEAETQGALIEAMLQNPSEWYLRSIYAELISEKEPDKALAILQELQKSYPTVRNSLMLGQMALRLAQKQTNEASKGFLEKVAGDAFEQAYQAAPGNESVLAYYSEFLRMTGQREKAESLLSSDQDVIWRYYLRDGRYDKAMSVLTELHASEPDNVEIIKGLVVVSEKLGDTEKIKEYSEKLLSVENTDENQLFQIQKYLECGLVDEAASKLASFRERNPDDSRGMLLEAWSKMSNGQLEESKTLLNKILEADVENVTAWRLRGQVNRLQGNAEQALEDLQKSRSLRPDASVRIDIAKLYRQTGRTEEAIGELRSALKDEQAPVRVLHMLEEIYIENNRTNNLRDFYVSTLDKYPDDIYWTYRAGRFYLEQEEYGYAENLLKKAFEASQSTDRYREICFDYYLESLFKSGKYQEHLRFATEYIDTELACFAYAQMGQTYFKMGEKSKAVGYFRTALDKASGNDTMMLGILDNMLRVIGAEEVVKWCDEKLSSNPDSLGANRTMFSLYQKQGEFNKALLHIDKCIGVVGSEDQRWSGYMVDKANVLISAYLKTNDSRYFEEGVDVFEGLLSKQPNNISALNNLAYLLADNNQQLEKAAEYGKRAYEGLPNDPSKMDTYAYTLCKVGDYSKAEELLLRALQVYELKNYSVPWDVYEHLGMAYEGLGESSKAVQAYNNSLKAAGENVPGEIRERLQSAMERALK